MLHLYWKIKFWLLGLSLRKYQLLHPFSFEKQESLGSRLDFLIFETLASSYLSLKDNLLIPLTNHLITVCTQHTVIKEKYPDFYAYHEHEFRMIESLSEQLDRDRVILQRRYEKQFKDPLPNSLEVRRVKAYLEEIYQMYQILYDGSFDTDCIEIMNNEQKEFYLKEFTGLRMETLSKSA